MNLPDPVVRLARGEIQFETKFSLRPGVVDEKALHWATTSVGDYLRQLDWYRNDRANFAQLPITGAFADAVKKGLEVDRSGVPREFVLAHLTIARLLVKPWGTPASAEATVTILDRPKAGSGGESRERGKLLLSGDRLIVVDGWDSQNARWFNSEEPAPLSEERIRNQTEMAVRTYLRNETWLGTWAISPDWGSWATDPFTKARGEYFRSLDRSTTARLFGEVNASIESVERFSDLGEGLATVTLRGEVTTTDPAGRSETQPFERTVIVMLTSARFTVVDELLPTGEWMSAGALMDVLAEQDRTFT